MAMSMQLFAVSPEELEGLVKSPDTIMNLDSKLTYSTYLWQSIPYFLGEGEGEEDEDEDEDDDREDEGDEEDDEGGHPLAAALHGDRSIKCKRLENGAFCIITAERVRELSKLLAEVKPSEIKERVFETDLEEALDGELWEELEQIDLTEPNEVAVQVVKDVKQLVKFYAEAAKAGLGIALYAS